MKAKTEQPAKTKDGNTGDFRGTRRGVPSSWYRVPRERVATAFDLAGMPTAGAPSFAQFAKGGNHEHLRSEVSAEGTRGCVGSIAIRPFDKLRAGSYKK